MREACQRKQPANWKAPRPGKGYHSSCGSAHTAGLLFRWVTALARNHSGASSGCSTEATAPSATVARSCSQCSCCLQEVAGGRPPALPTGASPEPSVLSGNIGSWQASFFLPYLRLHSLLLAWPLLSLRNIFAAAGASHLLYLWGKCQRLATKNTDIPPHWLVLSEATFGGCGGRPSVQLSQRTWCNRSSLKPSRGIPDSVS